VREQVGHLDARPAALLEGALAAEQAGVLLDELVFRLAELRGARLAVELVQQRLGGGRLQGAGPTGPEEEEDRLRLCARAVRRLCGQRVGGGGALAVFAQQRGQGESAEAAEGVAQDLAAARRESQGRPLSLHAVADVLRESVGPQPSIVQAGAAL